MQFKFYFAKNNLNLFVYEGALTAPLPLKLDIPLFRASLMQADSFLFSTPSHYLKVNLTKGDEIYSREYDT